MTRRRITIATIATVASVLGLRHLLQTQGVRISEFSRYEEVWNAFSTQNKALFMLCTTFLGYGVGTFVDGLIGFFRARTNS
jgi:hypothetical protein